MKVGPEPADSIYQAECVSCNGASEKPDWRGIVVQLLRSLSRNYKATIKRVSGLSRLSGHTGSMRCVPTELPIYDPHTSVSGNTTKSQNITHSRKSVLHVSQWQ